MRFFRLPKFLLARLFPVFFLSAIGTVVFGQSIDISSPSPVRTNEIVGRIVARDLGDARLTDHFYAFAGTPGDVLITVKGNNLNGDVDVFTAGSLRPLMKFTLYAESSSPVTKSIYLRKREDLVLRVEARTPNDDEGIYHIRLGGSFEPIVGEDLLAAAETPAPESATPPSRDIGTRRVSSVGARIPEPPAPPEEVAAAPTPEPTPAETPTPAATPDRAGETPERVAETEAPKPPRATRSTRGAGRRRAPPRQEQPPPEPELQLGPRLIIEMQDGTRIEHFMNTVRRVTVENNQIVVLNKLGRIQRIRMTDIVRMSIEP